MHFCVYITLNTYLMTIKRLKCKKKKIYYIIFKNFNMGIGNNRINIFCRYIYIINERRYIFIKRNIYSCILICIRIIYYMFLFYTRTITAYFIYYINFN